jgi:transposase
MSQNPPAAESEPALSPCSNVKPTYKLFCGIDIAAKTFTAAKCKTGEGEDEEPSKATNFKQSSQDFEALRSYLLKSHLLPNQILVVMEATGNYWVELAIYLHEANFAVSVINPSRLHGFAKSLLLKSKNDELDAQTLARLALAHKPACWTPPPAIYHELVQRLNQRADLLEIRQQLKNQLHALMAGTSTAVEAVVVRFENLIETLSQQLKELDDEIKKTIKKEEKWAKSAILLESISGIGWLSACWLVTLTLNFTACHKAESLVHYAGLAPVVRKSGSSVRSRPRIGYGGNGPLRATIFMAAMSAIRFNPVIKDQYERLHVQKAKPHKVSRCACARKLLHLAFAVVTKEKPFDPGYALTLKTKRLAVTAGPG